MTRVPDLAPAARAELLAAADWYEERTAGTGRLFADDVRALISRIGDSPEQFPRWPDHPRYRRAILRRFPFVVVFVVEDDLVTVVAIAHTSRDPGYWR